MSGEILLAAYTDNEQPGLLGEILDLRQRPWRRIRRPEDGQLPAQAGGCRALALLGPPDLDVVDPDVLDHDQAAIRACVDGDIPVLGLGGGAELVASALGGEPAEDRPLAGWVALTRTEAGADDALCKGLVDGAPWLTLVRRRRKLPAQAEALAAAEDGSVGAFRAGPTYGFYPAATLDLEGARAYLGHPALQAWLGASGGDADALLSEFSSRETFVRGWAASLLGRWVDGVIGRTEAEAPWGRRGPGPVPRPDVVLHRSEG